MVAAKNIVKPKIILTFDSDYQLCKSELICDSDIEEAELVTIESKIKECLKNNSKCFAKKEVA